MKDVHFGETDYASVVSWLEDNRGDFSVLIHQDTGDDFRDHTEGIPWLGKELPLKLDFFELIKRNPALYIHPPKNMESP